MNFFCTFTDNIKHDGRFLSSKMNKKLLQGETETFLAQFLIQRRRQPPMFAYIVIPQWFGGVNY